VLFDEVMDALRALDRQSPARLPPRYRRILRNRRPGVFGRGGDVPRGGEQGSQPS
jgi:hypothetical protein